MAKKNSTQPPMYQRVDVPKVSKDKDGNAILMCPFCTPAHPLNLDNSSSCGTGIQIRAVQTTYKAKFDKRLICIRCGEGGGEMVMHQNGFIHTHKCKEGVFVLDKPPEYSSVAKLIFKYTPEWFRKWAGAIQVEEIYPDGKKTGVVLGYAFLRGKNA